VSNGDAVHDAHASASVQMMRAIKNKNLAAVNLVCARVDEHTVDCYR
jgi:hypothetical protein